MTFILVLIVYLYIGSEEAEVVGNDLHREFLRDEAVSRLNELGKV